MAELATSPDHQQHKGYANTCLDATIVHVSNQTEACSARVAYLLPKCHINAVAHVSDVYQFVSR